MPATASLADLDARIAALRENIRELVEQAAAVSGASSESLSADRIEAFEAQLAEAIRQRDVLAAARK
jgi:N-methylhydantoinase B/oxoprolinase/acetone carboxylase alpha subunit